MNCLIAQEFGINKINTNPKLSSFDFLIGNYQPEQIKELKLIPKNLSSKKIFLRKDVLEDFVKMHKKALSKGIKLKIISGFRNFDHQKNIWNRKYKNYSTLYPTVKERVDSILQYSAYPGTSRHHWGTEIDINSLNNNYFTKLKYGKKVKKWLDQNASKYGFYLTYTPRVDRTGYNTEFWHYTHYPTASKMMHFFFIYVNPNSIRVFKDQNFINVKKIFKDYVLGIDKLLLKKMRLDGLLIEIDQ